ncbi:MAG TPA: polysaccharide biosynthesis C-terminal domain-containing protein [Candidatus Dormibacteraeota bacterium]|nr:polysaccharide biosynthesis C-terminal domain-containing protein [Candidatus Dormibacteraeota bacterium]
MTELRLPFVRRVAGVFATRLAQFALGFGSSLTIAKLLEPEGRGAYVVVLLVPGTLFALGQLGLPSAINYFAGRGSSIPDLIRWSVVLTVAFSIAVIGTTLIALPFLETNVLRAAPPDLLRLVLLTIPVSTLATFGGSILYGRQAIRAYNVILVGQSAASLVGIVALVGILGLGVAGAVATSIIVGIIGATAVMREVVRLSRLEPGREHVALRSLVAYGLRLYPASVTSYFSYRADVYLLQALLPDPGRAVGLYSYAVTMAELVFYVPDSVSTIFFPHVAGATPADSDRQVGQVSRFTMLITVCAALALIPAAWILFNVVLPDFGGSMAAMIVLLPGVVSLSLSKVLASYISGRGRPTPVSIAAVVALAVNIAANLVLIPRLGIVGASAASLISYTTHAGMMLTIASRLSGQSPWSIVVPGRVEFARLGSAARAIARIVATRLAALSGGRA